MSKLYARWQDVPKSEWRWPNFSPQEIACKGTGSVLVDPDALDRLQALRTALGRPLIITSAYRSPSHNRNVGGATNSMHLQGRAFDVVMSNQNPSQFEAAAQALGFLGIGHYPASNFMHIDTRSEPERWQGKGRNKAWFPASRDVPTPGFTEARPVAATEAIRELAPVVSPLLVGAGAMAQGDGPVQWALGAIAVLTFAAALVWFVRRQRGGENA